MKTTTNISQLQQAIRTALEPWSTVDNKLGALAYLESVGSPEAFAALRQAMELVGLYVSEKDKRDPNLPKAGEIAGAAALALARLEGQGGVRELLKILLGKEERLVLRECAAYGLGATESKDVFEAYQQAIDVENEVVFQMVVKSIDMSYRRLDNVSTEYSEDLLVFLFDWVVDRFQHGQSLEKLSSVVSIIARNLNSKQQRDLLNADKNSNDPNFKEVALEIWLQISSDVAVEALAKILVHKGEKPHFYKKIAERFNKADIALIKAKASKILNKATQFGSVLDLFSKQKRESRRAQIAAAKLILSKKRQVA